MSRPTIDDAAALDELRAMMAYGCRRSTALAVVRRNAGASEADRHRWARKLRERETCDRIVDDTICRLLDKTP